MHSNIPGPQIDSAEGSGESLELQGLLHALLRRAWIIAIFAFCGGSVGVFLSNRIPLLYQSRATLEVESRDLRPMAVDGGPEINPNDPQALETTVQNFRNRSLMERVAGELKLAGDPNFAGGPNFPPLSKDAAIAVLRNSMEVASRPKTRLIDVTFYHANPAVARRVAEGIVEQFFQQNTAQRLESLQKENSWLVKTVEETQQQLDAAEKATADYKAELNPADSNSLDQQQNLVATKLTVLHTQLLEANTERGAIERDLERIEGTSKLTRSEYLALPSLAGDPEVAKALARVDAASRAVAQLQERYGAKYPAMKEAQSELEAATKGVNAALETAPGRLKARYAAAKAKEVDLQRSFDGQAAIKNKMDEKTSRYSQLQAEVRSYRERLDQLKQRLRDTALQLGVQAVSFKLVEPALPAGLMPNKAWLYLIAAVLGGTMLGAGLVAGSYFLDSSLKTVDDAERLLGLPALGTLPTTRRDKKSKLPLVLLSRPDSPLAEAFRSLKTSLSLLGPPAERKVCLFTSAVPGEGKSTVSANVAIAFAQQGLQTLLIDADLRRPTLAARFDAPPKTVGLAEYLIGQTPQFVPTKVPNLLLLTAGHPAPNPAELLASIRFDELIRNMCEHFDRIIIDTAPINIVSDTLNLVKSASTVCLVVRSGSTSRKVVRRALEFLRRAGVRPAGLALNLLPKWSGLDQHYYYAGDKKYGGTETYGENYADGSVPAAPSLKPALTPRPLAEARLKVAQAAR